MIYRHFIAPSRAFSQFSHEIIRHPRLGSDATRLLTWQLSLPGHARETLSETAKRARIGATSFITAKRQLRTEGYVHERRVQVGGGLWVTQQLVSSTPLRPEEASKIFARMPAHSGVERVYSQVAPGNAVPAVGQPMPPSTDGHPEKDRRAYTSDLPPESATRSEAEVEEAEPEPPGGGAGAGAGAGGPGLSSQFGAESSEAVEGVAGVTRPEDEVADVTRPVAQLDEARALVGSLHLLSPALRHIPPGMREELTRLAARWLAAGHSSADVHEHVLRGLPGAGTPVQRPGGLVRYLLREVPPRALPRPAPTPPASDPRLSSRLEGTRECAGDGHTHPMLFRPVADETFCARCLGEPLRAGRVRE
ncbi:hypothetical protein ACIQ9R_08555 [Streptomyces sp. NPDC094447]|uniref:hypothetical protein n=1 Tax=Streptomyces sp. NPDC094447 TaxID=3366062 RepID=UPI0038204548